MIEFRIQEKTRSLNESFRGDWRPRDAIAKRQRAKAMAACPKWTGGPLLMVRVTRVSPRELDSHDNLRGALKHVVDGVAARLKIDNASPLVSWEYHQTKGQAEVVVQIWRPEQDQPPLPVGRPVERNGRARPGQKTPRGKAGAATERRTRCAKNGCRRLLPCPEHSHHLMANYTPPRGSRTNPMATKAIEPSNAAEHRALLAAMEAEATFAPDPACNWGHSDCCLMHPGERP